MFFLCVDDRIQPSCSQFCHIMPICDKPNSCWCRRGRDRMIGWIYNYLCNQCLSPITLWVRIPLKRDVLDTTLC